MSHKNNKISKFDDISSREEVAITSTKNEIKRSSMKIDSKKQKTKQRYKIIEQWKKLDLLLVEYKNSITNSILTF